MGLSPARWRVLIRYFLGIQADKMYITGFSDDLCEIIQTWPQPGENDDSEAHTNSTGMDQHFMSSTEYSKKLQEQILW
jgi:hypothetical protein